MSDITDASGFIEVSGTGRATSEADEARILITASAIKESMRDAASEVANVATGLREALAKAGITGASARTEGLRFEPEWRQEGQPQRFAARQTIAITSRDIEGAGALVSALVDAGGDSVVIESLTFARADTTELALLAQEAAFADARAKAEHYAALAGRHLGTVIAVTEGRGQAVSPLAKSVAREFGGADAVPAQPLEGAGVEVLAEVTVRWALA